jgi:hypothetical protein
MPTTTEIAVIPLIAGSDIGNPDHESARVFKSLSDTITRQDGFQQLNFGTQIEDPSVLQLMISEAFPEGQRHPCTYVLMERQTGTRSMPTRPSKQGTNTQPL